MRRLSALGRGAAQNIAKQESVPHLVGPGAHRIERQLALGLKGFQGSSIPAARYLGVRINVRLTATDEMNYRRAATVRAWSSMEHFWGSQADYALQKRAYKGHVLNAALSGAETLASSDGPLKEQHTTTVQAVLVRYGRVVLKGTAEMQHGHVKQASGWQVQRALGVASYFQEIRIRRLRWLQQMLTNPAPFLQVLVSVFGALRCGDDVFDGDGNLRQQANPWAKQWWADLMELDVLEEGRAMLEQHGYKPLQLLKHGAQELSRIDMKKLRQYYTQTPPVATAKQDDDELPFQCKLLNADGQVCSARFLPKTDCGSTRQWRREENTASAIMLVD